MKIAFLLNATIRKKEKVIAEVKQTFSKHEIEFFESEYAGHFFKLPKIVLDKGFLHLIVIGGDGTLNEVINGVIDAYKLPDSGIDWTSLTKVKIGVYAAGSGNDFIKTIYKNNQLNTLKQLIEKDSAQLIDVGHVTFFDPAGKASSRYYMNITDVGMGGEAVMLKANMPNWLGADFNYFFSITKTFATYDKVHIHGFGDNFDWIGKAINFVVANGKYFGNGLGIAPDASVTDGLLDIVIIGDVSTMDYFKHLNTVKACKKIEHDKIKYAQVQQINIESLEDKKISIDMDGEFIGYAPMTLTCLHGKINFIM